MKKRTFWIFDKSDPLDIAMFVWAIIFIGGQIFCFIMAIITGQLLLN